MYLTKTNVYDIIYSRLRGIIMTTREIEKQVIEAMNSGLYSVAGLDIFDNVNKIDISDNLNLHLQYTTDLLNEYLCELVELEGEKPGLLEFLKTIKDGDVIDNQSLEKENSFLIALYSQLQKETAMERLIRYAKKGDGITTKIFFNVHNTLLYGTSSDKYDNVRKANTKFVGRVINGERVIDYFPIDYKDIEIAASEIVRFYNSRLIENGFDNVFFQPFLIHGLVAALQMFNDGNTRLGRVMQHALIWQLINERTEFKFDLPPIYATRSYYPVRGKYRENIANLVKCNDSYAWNKWFDFNLDRIEDSIYAGRENLKVLKRKIEFHSKY